LREQIEPARARLAALVVVLGGQPLDRTRDGAEAQILLGDVVPLQPVGARRSHRHGVLVERRVAERRCELADADRRHERALTLLLSVGRERLVLVDLRELPELALRKQRRCSVEEGIPRPVRILGMERTHALDPSGARGERRGRAQPHAAGAPERVADRAIRVVHAVEDALVGANECLEQLARLLWIAGEERRLDVVEPRAELARKARARGVIDEGATGAESLHPARERIREGGRLRAKRERLDALPNRPVFAGEAHERIRQRARLEARQPGAKLVGVHAALPLEPRTVDEPRLVFASAPALRSPRERAAGAGTSRGAMGVAHSERAASIARAAELLDRDRGAVPTVRGSHSPRGRSRTLAQNSCAQQV
jgi:hypothetical protein